MSHWSHLYLEEVTVNTCTIKYSPAPVEAEATLVEVTFTKECSKQMVTVCQPQTGYHSHGYDSGYSKGEEIIVDIREICEQIFP